MRLNRKLVKLTLACGLCSAVYTQPGCQVSPEVVNSAVNAVLQAVNNGDLSAELTATLQHQGGGGGGGDNAGPNPEHHNEPNPNDNTQQHD